MKIRTQIFLLLFALVAVFAGGLMAFRHLERQSVLRIIGEQASEQSLAFDAFLKSRSRSLESFASEYYTDWDELVRAVANVDRDWPRRNITDLTLRGYDANAVWIYSADLSLFHAHNNIPAQNLDEIPLPKEVVIPALFRKGDQASFFLKAPQGLMEVRGVALRPAWDAAHETAPVGCLFAARLWTEADVQEMSLLTGHEVQIAPPEAPSPATREDEQLGAIAFQRELPGWDGKPVAQLFVRSGNPAIRELNHAAERLFLILVLFALALFFLLSIELRRLVTHPLKRIIRSLHHKDLGGLKGIEHRPTEFGELALLIRKFFEQRDDLVKEITERKATVKALRESEEKLRHSQKMEAIGRLAGGIAHDFNNLLTAIIGYSDLLGRQLVSRPELRQKALLINQAGEQAAGLTRQLLAFSRKQLLQPRVIDLNALVANMEKLLHRIIGEHIAIETQPAAPLGRITADPNQVEQVLLNLGVNARDAMPQGGRLTIATANVEVNDGLRHGDFDLPPGAYVKLSVADTGHGMDDETQTRIFEPFFTTKGPGKGTGLGLATVYGIVKQSNGGIAVESELGRGTTFHIYFPMESGSVTVAPPVSALVEPSPDGETVLVVEDEEVVRELVCDILKAQCYNVLQASCGAEALEISARLPCRLDLLITDMVMPQMNGDVLAEKLEALHPGLCVLYVSGYSENEILEQGVLNRQIEVLQKPFTPDSLARKVRESLKKSEPAGTQ